jgi:hypothetical protein
MPTSSNGKDNHSGQHLRTLEPEPPSSSARRESPSRPRTTTPDVVASLASRHNHRSPNPRLRPPLPPGAEGRNRRSRNPSRERLAHLNQSLPARHICVANRSEKYCSPHCSHVVRIFGNHPREYFLAHSTRTTQRGLIRGLAGSGQYLASVLQEGRENANIGASLGFIWRISARIDPL